MKPFIAATLFCLAIFACKAQQIVEQYQLDDEGITVEKFDSANVDEDRYNHNNNIYKVGKKFTFSYYYSDKAGTKYWITKSNLSNEEDENWTFEKKDKQDPNSVSQIVLLVNAGRTPFVQHFPDYNQTVITYNYKLLSGEIWQNEMTGVIENGKNTWLHPPRTGFFKILEINPFPYVKAPLEIGQKWNWKLKFGSHWSNKRWLLWEGTNENVYHYEVTGKAIITTKLGNLDCFEIESTATSSLGQTKLVAYFNSQFGFVKLNYTNIDGTKTTMELENVE